MPLPQTMIPPKSLSRQFVDQLIFANPWVVETAKLDLTFPA
jgi:hypothetical protein